MELVFNLTYHGLIVGVKMNKNLFRLIIIEDDANALERITSEVKKKYKGDVKIIPYSVFTKAIDYISQENQFDAVILDLFEGGEIRGKDIYELIWKNGLVPIIIHTAREWEELDPSTLDHPFIQCISKGQGSDLKIVETIENFRPFILALHNVHEEISKTEQMVIKETAIQIKKSVASSIAINDILVRVIRRRLAAQFDCSLLHTSEPLKAWEQYIYPPLNHDLLLGDILKISDADPKSPDSYRIILTASCDMQVFSGKRKADKVLVSRYIPFDEFIQVVKSRYKFTDEKLKENLPQLLHETQISGIIPLPKFDGILPPMASNLKRLELLNFEEISQTKEEKKVYERIISIDSPFRENISWAFMSIYGRPGLPERDVDAWAKEILPNGK